MQIIWLGHSGFRIEVEGAVLLALFSISGTLEHRAMGRARRAVEALMALRPDTALRVGQNGVEEVAVGPVGGLAVEAARLAALPPGAPPPTARPRR